MSIFSRRSNLKKSKHRDGDKWRFSADPLTVLKPVNLRASNEQIRDDLGSMVEALQEEIGGEPERERAGLEPLVDEFRQRVEKVLLPDSRFRIDLAVAYYEMGLKREGCEELRRIPQADPQFVASQCLLGQFLFDERCELQALEIFKRCLRDGRATQEILAESRYQLVKCYFQLGDLEQAYRHASKLEKLEPNYRNLKSLKKQIEVRLEVTQSDPKKVIHTK